MKLPMKYVAIRYRYEASNVTLNTNDMSAISYGWWRFLMPVDGVNYLNTYRYSSSTAKHIAKVAGMLTHLDIPYERVHFKQSMYWYRGLTPNDLADWTKAQTLKDAEAKNSKRLARNALARINRANKAEKLKDRWSQDKIDTLLDLMTQDHCIFGQQAAQNEVTA